MGELSSGVEGDQPKSVAYDFKLFLCEETRGKIVAPAQMDGSENGLNAHHPFGQRDLWKGLHFDSADEDEDSRSTGSALRVGGRGVQHLNILISSLIVS